MSASYSKRPRADGGHCSTPTACEGPCGYGILLFSRLGEGGGGEVGDQSRTERSTTGDDTHRQSIGMQLAGLYAGRVHDLSSCLERHR